MKLSHYIRTYPFDQMPGHLLVYSTKRAAILLLTEDTFQAAERGALSQEDEDLLAKTGILVPDREEEKREMSYMLDMLNERHSVLNISVIINLECNFSCVYCYEGDMKGKSHMSEDTAGLLIEFIKEKCAQGKKTVNLDFYGGEPLLSRELIKYISRALKTFTEGQGEGYTFTLVTNGSLLKKESVQELADLGLNLVKTTIDGPAEVHNKCRPFRSGAGSFDAIVNNIKQTSDIVKTAIGGNYNRDNYRQFPSLLDFLKEDGLTPDRVYAVKFAPVMNRPADDTSPADYHDGCLSVNEPWLLEADSLLREEILKRGYNTPKIIPSPCQVEVTDYYVVNYDGTLYKCPALIGKKGFEIGSLREGVKDYRESHKLGNWKNSECLECAYLPLCFGGCRYMAYVRDGNIDKPDCRRPYFDAALETLIKQEIKYKKLIKSSE